MRPVGAAASLEVRIAEKTFMSAQGVPVTALSDLSFDVRQGEFACLLGPSGCGKTTTLRILLGLDRDFTGTFQLPEGGQSPEGETKRIAAVFQEPTLLPWASVFDNVWLMEKAICSSVMSGLSFSTAAACMIWPDWQ